MCEPRSRREMMMMVRGSSSPRAVDVDVEDGQSQGGRKVED